ncbi:MAG: UDP-glucosyltransferase [Armatimonadota bacterium]
MRPPPAKPTPLRILNYAVNGLGLGHLTRLIAINRQIRRLAGLLGIPSEQIFLTSNEGDALAYQHGFASFKIPSKSSLAACGLDPVRHRKIAKQWVWNAVNLISPDILIVDTFPAGGFQELFDVLDLGSKNVFIYRAVRSEAALVPAFQSALRGYHLILKPTEQGENDSPVPDDLEDRVATTGEILIRSASEILSREEARDLLGIPGTATGAIYVSVGGGGDTEAETMFATVLETARRMPEMYFVIGAGSLYRGREYHAPNVSWTRRSVMMECFRAFDAALTAGGYNTVNELMHCGIPCVFLSQARTHDDQERRVTRCVEAGAGVLLTERTPEAIQAALIGLWDGDAHRVASEVAARFVPKNHALQAAEEILSLVADPMDVEDASLLADPEFFVMAQQAGIDEGRYMSIAHQIAKLVGGVQDEDGAEAIAGATVGYLRESQKLTVSPGRLLGALRRAAKTNAGDTPLLPETLTENALSLLQDDEENKNA